MRYLRRTILAALAVALCAAPVASAHNAHHAAARSSRPPAAAACPAANCWARRGCRR